MPRPDVKFVTFSIDGREVSAPENAMLVDGAKYGDVEIPVFCYEPKLGAPVGACRMCLVEIEGIPKLQTACSTPVKDGMVVHTQTDRAQEAQRSVVEFLLINHPLDCPVCDKGGECPLQDISFGWGGGTTRFIEPKRHFVKPLELSPLIAIDRERCILCYRCVRFSQEIAEDYQLVLQERGAHSFVSTFDGSPYVAPFTGNITELCPVGALTSSTYRFRARPWDIEGSGTVCAMCPSQCNVALTVRDDRVMRVLARDNEAVDDGWLCDKGRYAFQYTHSDDRILEPLVREGGQLMPASWDKALASAAGALAKAGARSAAIAGGETTNEEAFVLQRLLREGLRSGHVASAPAGDLPPETARALASPALQATVADLEFAHTVFVLDCDPVDEAAAFDLRIRKGVRRNGVRLAVAGARPTALSPNATQIVRTVPGGLESLLVALDAAFTGDEGNLSGGATGAGTTPGIVRDLVTLLREGGEDVVVVAAERSLSAGAAAGLLNLLARLDLEGRAGGGLLLIPASANGRGVREAGMAAGMGPGYAPLEAIGRDVPGIAAGLRDGALSALVLHNADPLRTFPHREGWEAALGAATDVIVTDSVMNDTIREHATVVFPGEAYPEKEGTLTHPDGRLQRLRPAIGRPGDLATGVRAGWRVLADISARAGLDQRLLAGPMASQALFEAVPMYRGLTLDVIGGTGLRWPESAAGVQWSPPRWTPKTLRVPQTTGGGADGALRLGTFKTLWAAKEVDLSPVLQFAVPRQVVELSPAAAERLGVGHGEAVEVGPVPAGEARGGNGTTIHGAAVVRAAIPTGSVFVAEGIPDAPANALVHAEVEVRPLGEYVGVPAPPGGAGALAEAAAAGSPEEDASGRGQARDPRDEPSQDRLAAEVGGADQTAPSPDDSGAGNGQSGPREATGGGATGEGEQSE